MRVNELKAVVNNHTDNIIKVLSTSIKSLEKRCAIESAFRVCSDAFMEVSTILINMLEECQLSGKDLIKIKYNIS